MYGMLVNLTRYRRLLSYLIFLNTKVRYRGSVFGFVWTLFNPLLLMLVLWAVFSRIGRFEEKNYAVFLLSGLLVWTFFSQSIESAQKSIIQQASLLQKIFVPKIIFPLSVVGSNFVHFLFSLVAYVIITYAASCPLGWTCLALPLALLMLYMLTTGLALIMSTINIFFRDFDQLTGTLLRALFYLTPIFYPPDMFGEKAERLLQINPLYYPVVLTRQVLYYNDMGSAAYWGCGFLYALLILLIGLVLFSRKERNFIFYV